MINNILRGFILFCGAGVGSGFDPEQYPFPACGNAVLVSLFHTENASGELTDECGVFLFSDRVDD